MLSEYSKSRAPFWQETGVNSRLLRQVLFARNILYIVADRRFGRYHSLVRNAANKGRVVLGLHFFAQVIPEVLTIVLPCSVLDSAK